MSKSSAPEFRTAYDNLQPVVSDMTALSFADSPSLTHQSFKDECDINKIIERLDVSGFLEDRGGRKPQYFDASQVPDYHTAMNQIIYAQSMFDELPADIRARFRNDPGEFVDFFQDPANQEEAISLGLATSREGGPERSHEAGVGSPSPAPVSAPKSSKKAAPSPQPSAPIDDRD